MKIELSFATTSIELKRLSQVNTFLLYFSDNWLREFEKWLPDVSYITYAGKIQHRNR